MTIKIIAAVIAAAYILYKSVKMLFTPEGAASHVAAAGVSYPYVRRRNECQCDECMEPTLRDTGYNDPPGLR